MPKSTLSDSLKTAKLNLIDYLGEDLYSILESGRIEADMPFGIKSKFNFRKQTFNFQKNFGKDYKFNLDINKKNPSGYRDSFTIGMTKKF